MSDETKAYTVTLTDRVHPGTDQVRMNLGASRFLFVRSMGRAEVKDALSHEMPLTDRQAHGLGLDGYQVDAVSPKKKTATKPKS